MGIHIVCREARASFAWVFEVPGGGCLGAFGDPCSTPCWLLDRPWDAPGEPWEQILGRLGAFGIRP